MTKIYFLAIFLIASFLISAQNDYSFKQYGDETGDFFSLPVKWNATDYGLLVGFSAATYLIMQYDRDVKTIALMNRGYGESIPMKFGTLYGEPYTSMIIGSAFLIAGNTGNNEHNKRIGFELLQSFSYTLFTTGIVKVAFGRARPYMDEGQFEFRPFSFGYPDRFSFFSGHTSLAFSMSTILAANQEKTIYKVLLYIPAVITGISRIYHNKHWTSDVFLGSVTGYFIARWVHETHDKKELGIATHNPILNISIGF